MFDISQQAATYLELHGNTLAIDLKLEPAIGDILCVSKQLTGCYAPKIYVGQKAQEHEAEFHTDCVNGITIYYHPKLQVKLGYSQIQFVLKKFLFWEWLELDGAKLIPIFKD